MNSLKKQLMNHSTIYYCKGDANSVCLTENACYSVNLRHYIRRLGWKHKSIIVSKMRQSSYKNPKEKLINKQKQKMSQKWTCVSFLRHFLLSEPWFIWFTWFDWWYEDPKLYRPEIKGIRKSYTSRFRQQGRITQTLVSGILWFYDARCFGEYPTF